MRAWGIGAWGVRDGREAEERTTVGRSSRDGDVVRARSSLRGDAPR